MNFGRPICSINSLQAETILSNASKRSSWRFCAICILGWTGSRKWNAMLMAAVSPTIASGDISGYRGCVQRFGSELGNAAETWYESELRLQRNNLKREMNSWGGSVKIFLRPKTHLRSKWTCCTNVKTQNQYDINSLHRCTTGWSIWLKWVYTHTRTHKKEKHHKNRVIKNSRKL